MRFGVIQNNDNIKRLMQSMDVMGDGKINYTEFLIATMDKKFMYDEEML